MIKVILIILAVIILIVGAGVGIYFCQELEIEKSRQTEETAVKSLVENFGRTLKNVSLLSPVAVQDIEQNYKDYIAPILLERWKSDSLTALGRLTSSPWPDRIDIYSIKNLDSYSYEVKGYIMETTSVEETQGGIASQRPITLIIEKDNNSWFITKINLGEYDYNNIAVQLKDCLPKSDMASHEKCQQLLNEIKNFDECIAAGFSIMKSNPPQCALPDGRFFIQETNSIWKIIVQAVNNCEAKKAFQSHSRIVALELKNGSKLIAAEPKIDEIIRIISEAEAKCGRIPIGTE